MKKPMLIVVLIVGLVLVAFAYLLVFNQPRNESGLDEKAASLSGSNPTDENEMSAQTSSNGNYVDYAPGIIEQTAGPKILFFHANWCPQCRALESDIQNSGLPNGVTVIKVDFDNSQNLREKYGVTQQTTLVKVDDEGNLQKKFVAYQDPSVASLKENLL